MNRIRCWSETMVIHSEVTSFNCLIDGIRRPLVVLPRRFFSIKVPRYTGFLLVPPMFTRGGTLDLIEEFSCWSEIESGIS